jgi:hypothetical protein
MYPVQIEFLCNHHANELTKFIKNSEKIHRFSFDHSPSIYIISRSNSLCLSYTKKEKFLTNL